MTKRCAPHNLLLDQKAMDTLLFVRRTHLSGRAYQEPISPTEAL